MILQWYKVVKLHLELFCSSNLVHFQLDQRNSNWSGMRFEQNNSNKWSALLNWAERIDRDFQSSPCPSLFNRCVKWRSKMFFFPSATGRSHRRWTRGCWRTLWHRSLSETSGNKKINWTNREKRSTSRIENPIRTTFAFFKSFFFDNLKHSFQSKNLFLWKNFVGRFCDESFKVVSADAEEMEDDEQKMVGQVKRFKRVGCYENVPNDVIPKLAYI